MKKAYAIIGPPGTGKSHEIMTRVQRVIQTGTDPKRVCLLSFTKAAAKELADRANISGIHISTIHSLAFQVLGLSREQVVTDSDLREFSKITKFKVTNRSIDHSTYLGEGDFYLACYKLAKAQMKDPVEAYDNSIREYNCNAERYRRFARAYETFKHERGLVDFSDMLEEAKTLSTQAFDHVFIDEAQDLSDTQWELIECWLWNWQHVHVAGDDDQAIYKWGGANSDGISNFIEKHGAEVRILDKSYRVPATVHTLAQGVISRVRSRIEKEYTPTKRSGAVSRRVSIGDAVASISHGEDVLFLYRNHAMRYSICDHLRRLGIPYLIEGSKSALNSGLGVAASIWERAVHNNWNFKLTATQKSTLIRFAKPKYAKEMKNGQFSVMKGWRAIMRHDKEITPYLTKVEKGFGLDVKPTIRMSTIHGSKGREADKVIVLNAVSKRTLDAYRVDPDSEIRTFYVAITRAKEELIVCRPDNNKYTMLGFLA